MATTIERIGDIVFGKLDQALKSLEDPSVSAKRDVRRKERIANRTGAETVASIAAMAMQDSKDVKRAVEKQNFYNSLAEEAVANGNDEDAKLFIAEALRWKTVEADCVCALSESVAATHEVSGVLDDMRMDISETRKSARYIESQMIKARMYEKASKVIATFPTVEEGTERRIMLENDADRIYNKARIYHNLISPYRSPLMEAESKYREMGNNSTINTILLEMKKRMISVDENNNEKSESKE